MSGAGGDTSEGGAAVTQGATHPTDVVLPDCRLSMWCHTLKLPDSLSRPEEKEAARKGLLEAIRKDAMLCFYKQLIKDQQLDEDASLITELEDRVREESERIEAAIVDAKENYGDVEVKDALLSKAHFLCRTSTLANALEAYEVAHDKTVGAGSRLDIILTLVRIGLLNPGHRALTAKSIQRAKAECEKGGDWERRNKLKIYEATLMAINRDFKEAAKLFLDCTAIFTATELMSFETFVFYTVVLSMLSLDRQALKSQVIGSPEIAQVLAEDGLLKRFLHSFHGCDYAAFMESLLGVTKRIEADFFLNKHHKYFLRQIRLKAYAQFLEPFKSVTLESMSRHFGVAPAFLEQDVADYISSGKLNCRINKVSGILECTRRNRTAQLYSQITSEGDALLSKVQKLSKITDM